MKDFWKAGGLSVILCMGSHVLDFFSIGNFIVNQLGIEVEQIMI